MISLASLDSTEVMISSSSVLKRLGLTDVSKDLGEFPRLVPWLIEKNQERGGEVSVKLMEIDLKDLKYIILKVLVFFGHGFNRFVLDMTLAVVESDVFFEITTPDDERLFLFAGIQLSDDT